MQTTTTTITITTLLYLRSSNFQRLVSTEIKNIHNKIKIRYNHVLIF